VVNRIGLVGISWRDRRASALERFTVPREEREARLPTLAASIGVTELIYLATCNRVELAFAGDGRTPMTAYRRRIFAGLTGREPQPGEAEHTFRIWQGEGAVEHLFLVAAGLDSARVGESEITGQFREAVELSSELALLGSRLEPVTAEALRVAKRVRPITEGRVGRVSLAEIAVRLVRDRLDRTPGPVALIGISPMTTQCGEQLARSGVPLIVVNRTVERAAALAATLDAGHRGLDQFRAAPDPVEALIVATGSAEPVLGRAELERLAGRSPSGEPPLVIDLAVPPNVAPEDALAADLPRIGMDRITERAATDRGHLLHQFADARALVDQALTDLRRQAAERLVGPMIAELRRRYRHTAVEGVERLFAKGLAGLGPAQREVVVRWAETLAHRFAHVPSVGLKDLAFRIGPAAVEAFFASADPELARELRAAADRAGLELDRETDQIGEGEGEVA
jgi:glutamyl-tRNA reductase